MLIVHDPDALDLIPLTEWTRATTTCKTAFRQPDIFSISTPHSQREFIFDRFMNGASAPEPIKIVNLFNPTFEDTRHE